MIIARETKGMETGNLASCCKVCTRTIFLEGNLAMGINLECHIALDQILLEELLPRKGINYRKKNL